ncbi:MAG: DNA alkylation repair protein [Clostridia bacterium]|nr:DNA alkylation repair protein [Clostridia bacterium]
MTDTERVIKEQLYGMADPAYRAFQSPLVPTVSPDRIIGVRVPALRRLARQMTRDGRAEAYLAACSLPHETYDEDNLHAFLIEGITDYDACMAELERFLPYIDNWATCDMCSPPILAAHPTRLLASIRIWLSSDAEFTVRYGLVMLMRHFLRDRFTPEILSLAAAVTHEGYYVRMALAWLFAEALAWQWDPTLTYIRSQTLSPWVQQKAIQKALESRKLTDKQKAILRAIREEGRPL